MYSPTVWTDGVTPVNAANLGKLEGGVAQGGIPADTVVAAAGHLIRNKLLAGDAQYAFRQMGDGALSWGPGGSTAPDTSLYRVGAGLLYLGGSLTMSGQMASGTIYLDGYAAGTPVVVLRATGDTFNRLAVNNQGRLEWGSGAAAVDTNLYRASADVLKTDDAFQSAAGITANLGGATQIWLHPDGSIYFGSAADVRLYRSAGGALTVQGALYVTGNFDPQAGRLGVIAQQVADWNLALDNGWYMASPGLNAPAGLTVWVIGEVIAHGAAGYRIQRVCDFTSQMDSQVWERRQQGGAWQPWVKVGFYGDGTGAQKSDSTVIANKFGVQLGTANQILIEADGRIYFGAASDTGLYRLAAGYLATDQAFYAKEELCANYAKATQILLQANGRLSFGNGLDTHLYRSAAGVLKTDGQIEVGATGIKFSNGSVQTVAAAAAKTVVGSVAGNGGIVAGSGFTVSRTGTGQYTITFSPAFATTPVVVVSPNRNGMIFVYADAPASTGGFSVIARTTGGGTEDNDFSFHAIAT